jgi:SOS-response transcriptional repressor LexA
MSVIDGALRFSHGVPMVTHDEIIAELVRQLDAKKVTGRGIASLLKIAPARVTEMRKGERRVQPHEMSVLAQFFGMGEIDTGPDTNVIWVPVIGIAAAGCWKEAIELPSFLVPRIRKAGCNQAFAVQIDGDSMDKLLPDGGYAVIDPDQKQLNDKRIYLIQNGGGETTIKRYRTEPSRFEPVSNNPSHKIIHMGEHEIIVLGRVVSYTSDVGL